MPREPLYPHVPKRQEVLFPHVPKGRQTAEKLPQTLPQTSTCYEDAWRFLIKEEEGELIHGSVQTIGKRINHAWVELPTGYIWEPEYREFMKKDYFYERAQPKVEARYTPEEAAIMVARAKKLGPWTDEEREQYLKKKMTKVIPTEPRPRREQALADEGRAIAERLGNGVGYYGPWLPEGPEGEFFGHLFQDDAVTGSSFAAVDYEQAKKALIEMRKKFGAQPPVFGDEPTVKIDRD